MLEIFVERIFRKQPGSRNMDRDSRKNWKISMVPEFAQTPPEHFEIFDRRRTSFGPLNKHTKRPCVRVFRFFFKYGNERHLKKNIQFLDLN